MDTLKKIVLLAQRLVRIGVGNPRRLSHVMGTALAASADVVDRSTDLLRFPRRTVTDLLPEGADSCRLTLAVMSQNQASISVLEFVCLLLLMKKARAQCVFEFGTYKGVSISQMALNLPEGARIYTLDLPEGQVTTDLPISIAKDVSIAFEHGKGSLVPADLRPRITFLQQDSARFDPGPYEGQVDFVFVDGTHNSEYVKNDSEKGWRMLRKGGIIAWHDCAPNDPDVIRYLLQADYGAALIEGTSLAYAVKSRA